MSLLLAILSIAAAVIFLAVLIAGLLSIFKPLVSVRGFMENITMGVRAIEHQTAPLTRRASRTRELAATAAERAARVDRSLHRAVDASESNRP